jgi:hypothetical protein
VDLPWAAWISWNLEDVGHRVLLAEWDMVPGTQWANEMDQGLRAADVLIAVVSPDYVTSAFASAEWQAKWRDDPDGRRRAVVPIVVRKTVAGGLLGGVTTIDLTGFAGDDPRRDREDEARRRLLDRVRHAFLGRAKPTVPPDITVGVSP